MNDISICLDPKQHLSIAIEENWQNRKPKIGKRASTIIKEFPQVNLKEVLLSGEDDSRIRIFRKENNKNIRGLGRAIYAGTVFNPSELPEIIFKTCSIEDRFRNALKIHRLLQKQKSKYIKLPKMNLYGTVLSEEKLSINTSVYYIAALYSLQTSLFDEAVIEFTRLFSKIMVLDLFISIPYANDFGNVKGVKDAIRFDNMPFSLSQENGKKNAVINFIDLEEVNDKPEKKSKVIKRIIKIFPFHAEQIIKEAENLKIKIKFPSLIKIKNERIKWYKGIFGAHYKWLKKNDFSIRASDQMLKIEEDIKNECLNVLKKELTSLSSGLTEWKDLLEDIEMNQIKGFCDDKLHSNDFAKKLLEIFFNSLRDAVEFRLKECAIDFSDRELEPWEMVRCRSFILDVSKHSLFKTIKLEIQKEKKIKFPNCSYYKSPEDAVVKQLCWVVFEQLAREKKLFLFDPEAGANDNDRLQSNKWWIRY